MKHRYDLGPGTLPYTRRIGANAPIVGAAKLSGRSVSVLSFGVFGAATGHRLDLPIFGARDTRSIDLTV